MLDSESLQNLGLRGSVLGQAVLDGLVGREFYPTLATTQVAYLEGVETCLPQPHAK